MKLTIIPNIDPDKILRKRGLGSSNEAQKQIATQLERVLRPYVPMSLGSAAHMLTGVKIASDGSTITYPGPYGHFLYVGEVMVGASGSPWALSGEAKRYAGRELTYNGGPMRGKQWDKRYMADHKREFVTACAKLIGGKAK
jgi:hypothetical protein